MYADDIALIPDTIIGLQRQLNLSSEFGDTFEYEEHGEGKKRARGKKKEKCELENKENNGQLQGKTKRKMRFILPYSHYQPTEYNLKKKKKKAISISIYNKQ